MIFVLAIGTICYMPNSESTTSTELGQDTDFVINAKFPDTASSIPYYKVVNEETIHESQSNIMKTRENLPSEDEATKIVYDFLVKNEQLPEDSYLSNVNTLYLRTMNTSTGQDVLEKEEPVLVEVSYNRQINGMPVAGPGDSITVSLGDEGEVLYLFKTWRKLEVAGEISIIDANKAIKKLQEGKTIQQSAGIERPIAEVNEIEIGYFSDVTGSDQEFYKPIWIFKCTDDHGNNITKCINGVE